MGSVLVRFRKKSNVIGFPCRQREAGKALLEQLFKEHGLALRSFLLARISMPVDELEDVVQEVYLKLAQQDDLNSKIADESGSTRAYLFTAANNLVIDMQRRQTLHRYYIAEQAGLGLIGHGGFFTHRAIVGSD